LKDVKSTVRNGHEAAKSGGKKGKKGKGAQPEETKVIEKCYVFVANEYPEAQKKCLEILKAFEYDENCKPVGDYVKAVKESFDKK
jgi:hypothetical protein